MQPDVACRDCGSAIPAGAGARCGRCYWLERCDRHTKQLSELLHNARTQLAFQDYGKWLAENVDPKRAALNLQRHSEFFVKLDGSGPEQWTSAALLAAFGTTGLRKFETPVRWLRAQCEGLLTEAEKLNAAELRRARELVATFAVGSEARSAVEDFEAALLQRLHAGEIKVRSVRMALRPAIGLLQMADSGGRRLADQDAVDHYLAASPGQRAALSTFIGFLRSSRAINLTLPRAPVKATRSPPDLKKQLAALVAEGPGAADFHERWVRTALAYFHRLPSRQAQRLCKLGAVVQNSDGWTLSADEKQYWIPSSLPRGQSAREP